MAHFWNKDATRTKVGKDAGLDFSVSLGRLNRTFIGSVLFIDIVGYTTNTVADQLVLKEQFAHLLNKALSDVSPQSRLVVDTGDGAAIAFLGDPEDALFAALSLRDDLHADALPWTVRMGVNLGPLRVLRDINGNPNMIGDAVNDAQRIMAFCEPGGVLVSRSYFDIVSRLSEDYQLLFVYEGKRQDKHIKQHDLYRFGPDHGNAEQLARDLIERTRARLHDGGWLADPSRQPLSYASPPGRRRMPPGVRPAWMAWVLGAGVATALIGVGAVGTWKLLRPDLSANSPAVAATTPVSALPMPSEAAPPAQPAAGTAPLLPANAPAPSTPPAPALLTSPSGTPAAGSQPLPGPEPATTAVAAADPAKAAARQLTRPKPAAAPPQAQAKGREKAQAGWDADRRSPNLNQP